MELKPISGPAEEPVTLADAKLTLRVDHAEDDSRIQRMIGAAREEAEQITSRRFGPQTWELVLDAFESTITLPAPPVTSVTSIKYDDDAGAEQTLAGSAYRVRGSEPAIISPVTSWPSTFSGPAAVRVRFQCGITSTDPRWKSLQSWILLRVQGMYEGRSIDGGALLDALKAYQ